MDFNPWPFLFSFTLREDPFILEGLKSGIRNKYGRILKK